ncbi:Uma2 family endonuclease [Aquibacillus sp. 3ASR75-11]|uniref:Uma2 family endonuclease n=1 Tax=Terrihalobacillus insolitus TaxID=2950438 RepID=A0A9X3WRB4_9BACI|nr:Uma2 family endonuclease [Terrihalobacillus insolitus]MDC3411888.1 Uma2 family endonuclease [Terrihalobacillus insolitus]MDC3423433.1 Uma2 family endonuclease [Terrihalobacillus insolitus]
MPLPKENQIYTYGDYLSWPEEERVEIIDGVPYFQSAPSRIHQKTLSELHRQIANYLVDKECEVYPAPFHVLLSIEDDVDTEEERRNVFEPDITIVCDTSKLDDHGCKGSPDMVIEIISPSTARKDKIEKFNKYEQAGVKEYWIVEPQEKIVSVFTLQKNNKYGRPDMYAEEDIVHVSIFDDLAIDLKLTFNY